MENSLYELQLKRLLQIWMVVFLGAAIMFLFLGRHMLDSINSFSSRLFPSLPIIALPEENFFLTLTTSLMVTLIFLCYLAQKDIQKNLQFVVPVLLSKFVSAFFFFTFLLREKALAYFVGLLTDGSIFFITYFVYWRVRRQRQSSF
jgi:hypothetical protein